MITKHVITGPHVFLRFWKSLSIIIAILGSLKPCLHLREWKGDRTMTIFWMIWYYLHVSTLPQRNAIDVAWQIRRAWMLENKFNTCAVTSPWLSKTRVSSKYMAVYNVDECIEIVKDVIAYINVDTPADVWQANSRLIACSRKCRQSVRLISNQYLVINIFCSTHPNHLTFYWIY